MPMKPAQVTARAYMRCGVGVAERADELSSSDDASDDEEDEAESSEVSKSQCSCPSLSFT